MRDYGKIHISFWTSQTIRSMSEDGRTLAAYLLTCPHGTISGVFRLPDGYACDDLQWTQERVIKAFNETLAKGFANRCETTKWVWVACHFKWNKLENPNQVKSAAKIASSIPDECLWKPAYMRVNAKMLGLEYEPLPNRSETVPEPVTVTVAVTGAVAVGTAAEIRDSNVENFPEKIKPNSNSADKEIQMDLIENVNSPEESESKKTKSNSPDATDTELQLACRATWNAYADAYAIRYGTTPVVNATVRSQIKNLVQRIGYLESPLVAAWFVTHADAFYVRAGHTVGSLTKDAEKLRTEWATKTQMTGQRAKEIEKTATLGNAVDEIIKRRNGEKVVNHG